MRGKILLGLVILILIKIVVAAPPFQTIEYRGFASINNTPVADGTEVSIYANSGTLKMHAVFTQFGIGFYDHLELVWDDTTTATDEGITPDDITLEQIKFKIADSFTTTPTSITEGISAQGALRVLDLDLNTSIDTQGPNITLISPANNTVDTDGTVVFEYSVTDPSGIANCSLFLNDAEQDNDTSVAENTTQSFTTSLSDNTFTWFITCFDNVSNSGQSETRIVVVNTSGATFIVAIATDFPLVAGKPTGINFTVNTSAGVAVQNATIKVTEKNGYAAFALTQKTISNVTNFVTAQTYTDHKGFVRFTIVPTGGADIIGFEEFIGNYSVTAEVFVSGSLVNTTILNVTERTILAATGVVTVPNQGDINNFRIRLFNIFNALTDWLT